MNDFIEMTKEYVEELEQPESKSRVETYNSFYRSSDDKSTSAWSVFYSSVLCYFFSISFTLYSILLADLLRPTNAQGAGNFHLESSHQLLMKNSHLMWTCLIYNALNWGVWISIILVCINPNLFKRPFHREMISIGSAQTI